MPGRTSLPYHKYRTAKTTAKRYVSYVRNELLFCLIHPIAHCRYSLRWSFYLCHTRKSAQYRYRMMISGMFSPKTKFKIFPRPDKAAFSVDKACVAYCLSFNNCFAAVNAEGISFFDATIFVSSSVDLRENLLLNSAISSCCIRAIFSSEGLIRAQR